MRLPEKKGVLTKVYDKVVIENDRRTIKQTVLFTIPERKITDDFGDQRTIAAEIFELDVLNEHLKSDYLKSLEGKKVVIEEMYLNSYTYQDQKTEETRYGKSITLRKIKEFKS